MPRLVTFDMSSCSKCCSSRKGVVVEVVVFVVVGVVVVGVKIVWRDSIGGRRSSILQ